MLDQSRPSQLDVSANAFMADAESDDRKVIAIIAGSGAGKTVFTRKIEDVLAAHVPDSHFTVPGDGFHRYGRNNMPEDLTHFDVEANELDYLEALLRNFKNGEPIETRFYIHNDEEAQEHGVAPGEFTAWSTVEPNHRFLTYEGLHGFVDRMREYVDLAIAVQPEGPLLWAQFYAREVLERGKSPAATVARWAERAEDYQKFIKPQIQEADMSIYRQFTAAFPFRDQIKMGEPLPPEVLAAMEQGVINEDTVKTVIKVKSKSWQDKLQDLPPHIQALQREKPFEFQVDSQAEQDAVLREIVSRV